MLPRYCFFRLFSVLMVVSALLFSPFSAHAAPMDSTDTLKTVEQYLSGLKTLKADFTQTAPDGKISSGVFHLKRPKQMRWQYAPPTPVVMVTRGNYLTYCDYSLNQVSDIPLDDTLLSVLSQQDIRFTGGKLAVAEQYEEKGIITITLLQKDNPKQGTLSMMFRKNPMQLQRLIVVDATGQTTRIDLRNIVENTPVADSVFEFRDPRIGGKRKKTKF